MLGLGTITKKVFGTPNDRKVKSVRPLVAKINALEDEFKALDDAGLIAKTAEFKERIANGESLDALLPEAFANAREGARRALGLRAFDTQLMGGVGHGAEGPVGTRDGAEGDRVVSFEE